MDIIHGMGRNAGFWMSTGIFASLVDLTSLHIQRKRNTTIRDANQLKVRRFYY